MNSKLKGIEIESDKNIDLTKAKIKTITKKKNNKKKNENKHKITLKENQCYCMICSKDKNKNPIVEILNPVTNVETFYIFESQKNVPKKLRKPKNELKKIREIVRTVVRGKCSECGKTVMKFVKSK